MVRAEDFDSSIVGSNPATPASRKPSERAAFVLVGVAVLFRPSAAWRVGSVSPPEDLQARLQGAGRGNFRHRRIPSLTGCRGRQPLPFKNYLQTHRCNGILDRFGLTKHLKCLQNCGIIKPSEAASPPPTPLRRVQNELRRTNTITDYQNDH